MKQVTVCRQTPGENNLRTSNLWGSQQDVTHREVLLGLNDGIPWPLAGTFRNLLVALDSAPGGASWPFWLYLNQVATPLSVTLTGATQVAADESHDVAVLPDDDVQIVYQAPDAVNCCSWSWEFESQTPTASGYGGAPQLLASSPSASWGAFSDGVVGSHNGSIAGCDGAITQLRPRSLGAPGVGTGWTYTIAKNGVVQDGTGGTVDTRTSILDPQTSAVGSFTLPVVAGDLCLVTATKIGAPANVRLTFGLVFTATTPGQFHTCGCTTIYDDVSNPLYSWNGQTGGTEALHPGTVGKSGLVLTGMRVYGPNPTPSPQTFSYYLRKNGGDPPAQPSVVLPTLGPNFGSDLNPLHTVAYARLETLDLKMGGSPDGTAANTVYWGFLSTVVGVVPPPPPPPPCPACVVVEPIVAATGGSGCILQETIVPGTCL